MGTPKLFEGRGKWWLFEVVFDRPLKTRELRLVRTKLAEASIYSRYAFVYSDGIPLEQWPEKWPSVRDGERTLAALKSAGVPFRYRAAPFGRDCDEACEFADKWTPCGQCDRDSNVDSCDPVWVPEDWKEG